MPRKARDVIAFSAVNSLSSSRLLRCIGSLKYRCSSWVDQLIYAGVNNGVLEGPCPVDFGICLFPMFSAPFPPHPANKTLQCARCGYERFRTQPRLIFLFQLHERYQDSGEKEINSTPTHVFRCHDSRE